jgi:hypothetical protein
MRSSSLRSKWEDFVRALCGTDSIFADSVFQLLSSLEKLGNFLETPAGSLPAIDAPTLPRGTVLIQRFEILNVLGEGGMGIIYRVRDHSGRDRCYQNRNAISASPCVLLFQLTNTSVILAASIRLELRDDTLPQSRHRNPNLHPASH